MSRRIESSNLQASNTRKVRALSRGLCLLEVLAAAPNGLSLSEIAREANLSKSSTHRLLQTLVMNGYILQDPNGGHYHLSFKLLELSSYLIQDTNLNMVARPHLEHLAQNTGETVHLVLLDHNTAVYVEKVESPNPIRMYSRIGMRAPLHCTGIGKAILAFLPSERRDTLINHRELKRYTKNTITDPEELHTHLAEIRKCGYSTDDGEHEEHVRCIAAPLFARNGQVVGAMSIAAISYRVDMTTLLSWWPSLNEHASQLNTELIHYFERFT
jgi:DNA-binding IclR family transcriptional regulator